jgi:hypothetical protein
MDHQEVPHGFLRRLSSLRPLRAPSVWICFALAVTLVAAAVPRRQVASRIATEAWIPMRALTPPEAAALLAGGQARLARIGADSVDLVTSDYLVPLDSFSAESSARDVLTRGGHSWRLSAAGWNGYSLRYRLARGPLERELAGRPLAAFLDPAAAARPVSFDSRYLALYAVTEVMLLWAAFLLAWTIARRVRPWHLVPPALLLLVCGWLVTVNWYAPAHFDADAFFQRWVVEEGLYYLIPFAVALVPVSVLSLLGLCAVRVLNPAGRRRRIAASWAPAALLALAVAGVHGLAWLRPGGTASEWAMFSRMGFSMIFWWW